MYCVVKIVILRLKFCSHSLILSISFMIGFQLYKFYNLHRFFEY